MDPFSQLFAAYLEMVSNNITSAYVDASNTAITSQALNYQGTEIQFQYFLWQVKQESVCANLKQLAIPYSNCTQQAKAMFTDLCKQLSAMNNLNNKGRSLSRMYCNASLNYKPMIASISQPKQRTESELKERECNRLILEAMQDNDSAIAKQRDLICSTTK